MSAPTKSRLTVDTVGNRDHSTKQMSSVEPDNLASERVIHLHNEIFAKGVLPAL
jgi:hypothetical protein